MLHLSSQKWNYAGKSGVITNRQDVKVAIYAVGILFCFFQLIRVKQLRKISQKSLGWPYIKYGMVPILLLLQAWLFGGDTKQESWNWYVYTRAIISKLA